MKTRTRNALAAGLVAASLAAAPLTNAQLFEGQRSHGDSKELMLASELIASALTEPTGPAECLDNDGDGIEDGLEVGGVAFECTNIDLLSFTPRSELFADLNLDVLTGGGLSDIWGWVSPETGDEYVIVGATNGAAAVRVTDPENPEYLGHVFNTGVQLVWFDIKVNNDHAYIVSESLASGMKILDLTLLDSLGPNPIPGATVPLPFITFPLELTAHNVVIDEDADMLYLVGGGTVGAGIVAGTSDSLCAVTDMSIDDNQGLLGFDISQPKLPVFVGCHATEGYVHDAQCATYTGPDPDHQGASICITAHEDGVAIVDVTDPAAPVTLSTTDAEDYPGVAYAHQGWMDESQEFYYHGDELDEQGTELTRTFVFDIRDLDDIALHFINEPGGVNIDHNMYTHEGLLHQSNYTAGLQVFDTAFVPGDEAAGRAPSLPMVAEFDVFPDDAGADEAVFAGTWSNYPYFPSGTLAVTATEDGLFLLKLDESVVSSAGLDDDPDAEDPSDDPADDPSDDSAEDPKVTPADDPEARGSDRFSDVVRGSTFDADIGALAASGITRGCNPPDNTLFCPDRFVTREQMAAFLTRALELPAGTEQFDDVASDDTFAADIGALARAGVTRGCNPPSNTRFCPGQFVSRGQMAAFLTRALDLPAGTESFDDVASDDTFAADIGALARAGITRGCNPPDNTRFCPDDLVTREQMAAFLTRAGLTD